MKYLLAPLFYVLTASLAAAHDSVHLHHHLNDSGWLPVVAGILLIVAASVLLATRR
ncbi:hypothetical protein LCGC14_1629450 [marine sediment metagenome]|uniref:Uncharacterized protein n=1 Tax=marine sediment metagenome TaxID=412755 RepID=A0A0F9I3G5_9ZZZZ